MKNDIDIKIIIKYINTQSCDILKLCIESNITPTKPEEPKEPKGFKKNANDGVMPPTLLQWRWVKVI